MTDPVTNKIIVSAGTRDLFLDYADYGLSFESTESEILTAVNSVVREQLNVDLQDEGDWLYKIRKAIDSQNIHVIPNSVAG